MAYGDIYEQGEFTIKVKGWDKLWAGGLYSGTAPTQMTSQAQANLAAGIDYVQQEFFAGNPNATVKVSVGEGAKLVRQGLENLEKSIKLIGRYQIYRALLEVAREARIYPPPPSAPSRLKIAYPKFTKSGKRMKTVEYVNPPKFNQYVRTYKLQKSVKIRRTTGDDSGWNLIVDPYEINRPRKKRYGLMVKGDQMGSGQAKIHKGRWKTLFENMQGGLIESLPEDIMKEIVQLKPLLFESHLPKPPTDDEIDAILAARDVRSVGRVDVKFPKEKSTPRVLNEFSTTDYKVVEGKVIPYKKKTKRYSQYDK